MTFKIHVVAFMSSSGGVHQMVVDFPNYEQAEFAYHAFSDSLDSAGVGYSVKRLYPKETKEVKS